MPRTAPGYFEPARPLTDGGEHALLELKNFRLTSPDRADLDTRGSSTPSAE